MYKDKILILLAVFLVPNIFLFHLYKQNLFLGNIFFSNVVLFAAVFSLVSMFCFFFLRLISGSYQGAFIPLVLFWLVFWLFEPIYNFMVIYFTEFSSSVLISVIGVGLILLAAILRRYRQSFDKYCATFNTLALIICVLFFYNFLVAFSALTVSHSESLFYVKKDFIVDDSLPNPDIYWIHLDGMMDLDTTKRIFGHDPSAIRQELNNRGFKINEDAFLYAGSTVYGVAAMLSPAFYDSYFGSFLNWAFDTRRAIHLDPSIPFTIISDRLIYDGVCLVKDVAPYMELFHAFEQTGYTITFVGNSLDIWTSRALHRWYELRRALRGEPWLLVNDYLGEAAVTFAEQAGDLFNLLSMATPLPDIGITIDNARWYEVNVDEYIVSKLLEQTSQSRITYPRFEQSHERDLYRATLDILDVPSPKLSYLTFNFTHASMWILFKENPDQYRYSADLYVPAFEYGIQVMLNVIDLILEYNPNAIIILQADHGLNQSDPLHELMELGWSFEDTFQGARYSTFSAVRIPELYGGLDEPLDPLNISRELVNRFVGFNYPLISKER